jgi:histidinol phosphatase-like enzyme (inositol monophosphatase family)
MPSCPDLSPFLDLANRLADASGDVIRKYFRAQFEVVEKADSSPVTIADRESEQALRVLLAKSRPDDGVWGEEFGCNRMDAPFVWVFDPIDGTRAFACGKPLFGTLIGLLYEGRPVLGVIDQPILKERWIGADGIGSFFNAKPCKTRSCAGLKDAVVTLSPHPFPEGGEAETIPFRKIAKQVKTTSMYGDCYAYGLLASGFTDLVLENGLKLHDFAALVPVVRNAGGAMTDWQGGELGTGSTGEVLAVGDTRVLRETFDFLRGLA